VAQTRQAQVAEGERCRLSDGESFANEIEEEEEEEASLKLKDSDKSQVFEDKSESLCRRRFKECLKSFLALFLMIIFRIPYLVAGKTVKDDIIIYWYNHFEMPLRE
jgi:hypothetical protein